jgi:hypothetical protein
VCRCIGNGSGPPCPVPCCHAAIVAQPAAFASRKRGAADWADPVCAGQRETGFGFTGLSTQAGPSSPPSQPQSFSRQARNDVRLGCSSVPRDLHHPRSRHSRAPAASTQLSCHRLHSTGGHISPIWHCLSTLQRCCFSVAPSRPRSSSSIPEIHPIA